MQNTRNRKLIQTSMFIIILLNIENANMFKAFKYSLVKLYLIILLYIFKFNSIDQHL